MAAMTAAVRARLLMTKRRCRQLFGGAHLRKSPEGALSAINNVRGRWAGGIEGSCNNAREEV